MNRRRLPYMILRSASFLAPGAHRAEWLEGWTSELWYVPERRATAFCLGAFEDALWVRQNTDRPRRLESAGSCLLLLATAAALSLLISIWLLGPLGTRSILWRLSVRDLPAGCAVMLVYSVVLLPLTRLAMGPPSSEICTTGWLARGSFLAAKVVLVQPILLCVFFALILIVPVAPLLAPLATCSAFILTFRWVISDQRRRCPVCLRVLANPIRFGAPSNTLLGWYGTESVCSRDHGFSQVPETSTSYSGSRRWFGLAGVR